MLTYLLIWMVACKGTAPDAKPVDSDTRPSIPVPTTETSTTGPLPCAEALVPALEWFDVDPIATWEGSLELGQTHVIREVEDRLAPSLSAERETLLLFHPTEAIEEAVDVRVAAFAGEDLLGVLAMSPPSQLPQALEQGLTSVTLDPYSVSAWSANLPWSWMMEGVELRIAHLDDAGLTQRTTALTGLAPPHVYTINHTKTMYFGGGEEDLSTLPGPRLAQDHFSTVPGAELRLVEVTPWRLDELVVNTDQGPRLVRSEGERQSTTNSVDRWDLLKYQVSLRHSLANTGRGLSLVHPWEGDSSPYSYGTSLGMGWVVNDDGSWSDLNNAPYAAGWTGWTSIWLSECGNTLTHELGHSYTLLHFVAGTSAAWGIEDEYPLDGVNLPDHPWGYDTTRRALRTWYEVTSAGPVDDGYGLSGKHDPMNGGDSANALHCYPQYTAYTAGWIQDWATGAPTLMDVQGTPGAYLWNAEAKQYDLVEASSSDGEPLAVDVPVLTFVGTLGNADEACQTYPPRRASLGNVFALPDPEDPDLPSVFDGAQWFVEILYAVGRVERGLIARSEIAAADVSMYLYSFNIKAEDDPIQVDLLRSPTGHPSIDISAAERVHTRIIEPSAARWTRRSKWRRTPLPSS